MNTLHMSEQDSRDMTVKVRIDLDFRVIGHDGDTYAYHGFACDAVEDVIRDALRRQGWEADFIDVTT